MTIMAVVAAMMSTTATTPPTMAAVLSEAELDGSGATAVRGATGGVVTNTPSPGATGAAK